MDVVKFTDEEIAEELNRLGYQNIPRVKLQNFQKDLNNLVLSEGINTDQSDLNRGSHCADDQCRRQICVKPDRDARQAGQSIVAHNVLRKEHMDVHSEKHCCHGWRQERWRRREGAAPGSYSLYQIPPSTRLNNDDVVSETDSEIRKIKRKTLRRTDDGALYIDESVSDIDAGVSNWLTGYDDRDTVPFLSACVLCDLPGVDPSSHEELTKVGSGHPLSSDETELAAAEGAWRQSSQGSPLGCPGTDAVLLHAGQADMAGGVGVQRAVRTYVPNSYVPPPDKKRNALRWRIRLDMAQNTMPI